MEEWKVTVRKLTDVDLLRRAASMTIGKESKITLKRAYALGHSLQRTQIFWIEFHDIPLCICQHLVRHVHAQPYVLSKRPDRGGVSMDDECRAIADGIRSIDGMNNPQNEWTADMYAQYVEELPNHFGRKSPISMGMLLNAEEIISISRVRMCNKSAKGTRGVWNAVVSEVEKVDPDLFLMCVPNCIHQGFCREKTCCGFSESAGYKRIRNNYKELFK